MRSPIAIYSADMFGQKISAEYVNENGKEYIALSHDGQEVAIPKDVIVQIHEELEIVNYMGYVKDAWDLDFKYEHYEIELDDKKIREIAEEMVDFLHETSYPEQENEELNDRLCAVAQEIDERLAELICEQCKEDMLEDGVDIGDEEAVLEYGDLSLDLKALWEESNKEEQEIER